MHDALNQLSDVAPTWVRQEVRWSSTRATASGPTKLACRRMRVVESSLSPEIRRFDLRRSRYLGLAQTHLQQLLNATAMNVVRVIAWLRGEPLGERQRQPGHFARLAPHPLSRQAVLC
jgi:Transposase DDE domain